MRKAFIGFCSLYLFTLICGVALAEDTGRRKSTSSTQLASPILNPTSNINELKRKCINAAIEGVSLDKQRILNLIDNYKGPQPGAASIEELRGQLEKLENDLSKYENIYLNSYQLPEKIDLEAWTVGEKVGKGDQIYFKHQSRSGPFYHITGINGNNYAVIEPNATANLWDPTNKYLMTIYLVCRRYYSFPNYYIYIDSLKKN